MQDQLKQLKEKLAEGKKRWDIIEHEIKDLRIRLDYKDHITNQQLAEVLILLVEHLRPLYSAQGQEIDLDAIIKKFLKK